MDNFIMGLKLGRQDDYTAWLIAKVLDKVPAQKPVLRIRDMERARDMPYPKIVSHTRKLLESELLRGFTTTLIVDCTDVGRAVLDMFRDAELEPVVVTLTDGGKVTRAGGEYQVPKNDLVGAVYALGKAGRLQYSYGIPLYKLLECELLSYQGKITPEGTVTESRRREGEHDDILCALSLVCWYQEGGYEVG